MNSILSSLLIAVAFATPLGAATLVFNGVLEGSQAGNLSPGTGSVSLSLNDATGAWSLTGNFSGLSGNSTNAHIHGPALPGVSAGVIAGLTFSSGVTSGTISGAGSFSPTQMSDLISNLYYVNLHSTVFPGGELRAQLVPEPSTAILSGAAALLALRRRRR